MNTRSAGRGERGVGKKYNECNFFVFIPNVKFRYWKGKGKGKRKKRGKRKGKESARNFREKKKEKKKRSAKRKWNEKLYILNRRGGLRPEGGRFFTLRRLVDAPVLKKNREKNEGKRKRQKTH